jgi:hypothetical protein
LIFITIFVYLAASAEAHLVATRAMSRGVLVTAAMMTPFVTLTPDEHVDAAVETLLHTRQGEFPWSTATAGLSVCSPATISSARLKRTTRTRRGCDDRRHRDHQQKPLPR